MVEFFSSALLALALGGLIGLERERSGHPLMGVRSFALCGLVGFLATILPASEWTILVGLAGFLLLSGLIYHVKSEKKGMGHGITTVIMLPLTFLFGVLVGLNLRLEAAAVAIAVTFILLEKSYLHHAAKMVTREELTDLLVFAIIAFIAYPFIPTHPVVLWGIPLSLEYAWKVVTLMTAISFGSHLLIKYTKHQGAQAAAFLGATVSSLATLLIFSRKVRDAKHLMAVNHLVSVGTVAGSLLVLAVMSSRLFEKAFLPLSIMGAVFLAAYFTLGPRLHNEDAPLQHRIFSLAFIAKFALVFLAVGLLFNLPHSENTLWLSALLGGALSSTSVIASLGYLFAGGQVSMGAAVTAAVLSVIGSSFAKSVFTAMRYPGHLDAWTPAVLSMVSGALGLTLFSVMG